LQSEFFPFSKIKENIVPNLKKSRADLKKNSTLGKKQYFRQKKSFTNISRKIFLLSKFLWVNLDVFFCQKIGI